MKKLIAVFIISLLIVTITQPIHGQSTPPPPPDHGSSDNQFGGGAPISSGLAILLALGVGYGANKIYRARRKKISD